MARKFNDATLPVVDRVESELWRLGVTHHLVPEMV